MKVPQDCGICIWRISLKCLYKKCNKRSPFYKPSENVALCSWADNSERENIFSFAQEKRNALKFVSLSLYDFEEKDSA